MCYAFCISYFVLYTLCFGHCTLYVVPCKLNSLLCIPYSVVRIPYFVFRSSHFVFRIPYFVPRDILRHPKCTWLRRGSLESRTPECNSRHPNTYFHEGDPWKIGHRNAFLPGPECIFLRRGSLGNRSPECIFSAAGGSTIDLKWI